MAFRLATTARSPVPVDMGRVADWFLANLGSFEGTNPMETVPIPVQFLAAVSARLIERVQDVETAVRKVQSQSDGIAAVADSIRQLAESVTIKAERKIESPYLTKGDAAAYLHTTEDAIYGRVERGQLERCPGVREYLFTKEMLDDSVMGRVKKPLRRSPARRGGK